MIKVEYSQSYDRFALRMRGHAEFNPGNDIVCAGCSAIIYALAGWLRNSERHIIESDVVQLDSGSADIKASGDMMLMTAFEVALIGLMQIAAKYPENVLVKKLSVF